MKNRYTVFSIVSTVAYTLAYYFEWPLFRYYPGPKVFSFLPRVGAGFAMLWYGWAVTAALAGFAATLIVPRRWSERVSPDLAGMVLVAAIFAALIYEKRWFL